MKAKIEGIQKMKHLPSNFESTGTKFHTMAWNYPPVISIVFTHFLFQPCKAEKHRSPNGLCAGKKKGKKETVYFPLFLHNELKVMQL